MVTYLIFNFHELYTRQCSVPLLIFFLLSRLKLANIKESSIKPKANKDSLDWKG